MKKNIALVCSSGGHLNQIKLICNKDVVGDNRVILITESDSKHKEIKGIHEKAYYFRKDGFNLNPFVYLSALFRMKKILKEENIDIVLTTGAQISLPALMAAKMLGIKTAYMETVIRVKTPTWSGKLSYPFADRFLVQNPGMEKYYGKRAEYAGGIL